MRNKLNTELSAEEAQFREDVHAVFEEAGGPLTEDEIIERVRCRQLQRLVDGLVEDGHAVEVEPGRYTFSEIGLERLVRAS